jgi:RNA polymerase sigma factor (sigma-70 family)
LGGAKRLSEDYGTFCLSSAFLLVMVESNEQELLDRCREGDQAALAVLFHSHYPKSLRVAFGLIGDRQLAEDAVQEGFSRAIRGLHKLDPGVPFDWWLLRSVTWASRTEIRRRRPEIVLRDPSELPEADVAGPNSEMRLLVLDALRRLSPRSREVVIARFYLGYSERESAKFLGCRPGTVKSRTYRALRLLGRDLRDAENKEKPKQGGEDRAIKYFVA